MERTYPGLEGVVVARTALSSVNGTEGKLTLGGYPVQELVRNSSYEEAAYLLWHGVLPKRGELDRLCEELKEQRSLPQPVLDLVVNTPPDVHPMAMLRTAVSALGTVDPRLRNGDLRTAAIRLVAATPTMIAAFVRSREGRAPVVPSPSLGHAANFLYMLSDEEPPAIMSGALDAYLVTVIDHGMNASTFTARVIASTRSDLVSAVVGAIGALKGPLHGGAPTEVLEMLEQVGAAENAERWVRSEVAHGERIMGVGHRVYKTTDPRAVELKRLAEELAPHTGAAELFALAQAVERAAIKVLQELKPDRKLYTNVEFYTALLLHELGIPTPFFGSIFAMSRMGGWTAHVMEQSRDNRLIRPRSEYIGAVHDGYVPIDQR
jgi:citrate synthase